MLKSSGSVACAQGTDTFVGLDPPLRVPMKMPVSQQRVVTALGFSLGDPAGQERCAQAISTCGRDAVPSSSLDAGLPAHLFHKARQKRDIWYGGKSAKKKIDIELAQIYFLRSGLIYLIF